MSVAVFVRGRLDEQQQQQWWLARLPDYARGGGATLRLIL